VGQEVVEEGLRAVRDVAGRPRKVAGGRLWFMTMLGGLVNIGHWIYFCSCCERGLCSLFLPVLVVFF
jgi:hypothetical protein